eukprot:365471-Chlamydomonas_euryale.AAC.10
MSVHMYAWTHACRLHAAMHSGLGFSPLCPGTRLPNIERVYLLITPRRARRPPRPPSGAVNSSPGAAAAAARLERGVRIAATAEGSGSDPLRAADRGQNAVKEPPATVIQAGRRNSGARAVPGCRFVASLYAVTVPQGLRTRRTAQHAHTYGNAHISPRPSERYKKQAACRHRADAVEVAAASRHRIDMISIAAYGLLRSLPPSPGAGALLRSCQWVGVCPAKLHSLLKHPRREEQLQFHGMFVAEQVDAKQADATFGEYGKG